MAVKKNYLLMNQETKGDDFATTKQERGKREGSVGFDQTGWNVLAPMFAV